MSQQYKVMSCDLFKIFAMMASCITSTLHMQGKSILIDRIHNKLNLHQETIATQTITCLGENGRVFLLTPQGHNFALIFPRHIRALITNSDENDRLRDRTNIGVSTACCDPPISSNTGNLERLHEMVKQCDPKKYTQTRYKCI